MKKSPYQIRLEQALTLHFDQVFSEWSAFSVRNNKLYSPCVDIAIGPINDEQQVREELIKTYDRMLAKSTWSRAFLERCFEFHLSNLREFLGKEFRNDGHASWTEAINANKNSRCFIAIEIEDQNSVKHIMGSMVNAASLGRIGLGIGCSKKAIKTFLRHIQYFTFLKAKEKGSYETANFIVLTDDQIFLALQQ